MLLIKWNNEKMSVGIELIDNQHKKLIDLINNIMLAIQNQRQIENIENFIEDAVNYAQYHFATEENLFHELDLSEDDIKRHKKEHQDFIDKVNNLYLNLKKDKSIKNSHGIEMSTELFNFLSNWLIHHIMLEDKHLLLDRKEMA